MMKNILFCLLCATLFLGSASGQEKPSAKKAETSGPLVEMEPYVVRDSRILPPPEQWHYVKVPALELLRGKRSIVAPGYEMLSNLNASQTRVLVEELQLRQFAATYIWPMLTQALPKSPVYVVVDINQQFLSLPGPVLQLSGAWEGDPIVPDTALPLADGADATGVEASGFIVAADASRAFAAEYGLGAVPEPGEETGLAPPVPPGENARRTEERQASEEYETKPLAEGFVKLVANGGPLTALIRAGDPAAGAERPSEERLAATLSYELSMFALNSLAQKPPPWFARGLGSLLGSTQVSQTHIQFALVRDKFTGRHMPNLSDIFQKKDGDSFTTEESRLASVFVHYGLYAEKGKFAPRFMKFVDRLERGEPPTEALFNETFGSGLFNSGISRMETNLAVYSRDFAFYKSMDIKGDIPPMPPPVYREATQAEVARIKAEVHIAQGALAKALNELRVAYWRGERDPAMLAILAMLEQQSGSESRARKLIQPLLALPKPPPRAYITAARIRLKDTLAIKLPGAKLGAEETSELISVLSGALAGGLTTEDLCTTLAEVVTHSSVAPDAGLAAFLREAAKRYPKNKTIAEASKLDAGPAVDA
ncbi:hypothetical protein OH491_12345 [Termitidicoccus mucosus]|uniref:DUF1570 domain-containing protein n=1 Tax=Termitidicoccus mucosus TaxID=1184151 RepID=A0A178IH24_9BACT|nr:hypothetical protein AW736_15125 [Opitutaceae bacterium TSB47]